ncbi:hypothetical protein CG51_17585 [Haematobacter missouriensis]|nr:hypothetical protein CG51_17585 [Haematobacter missouriensis]
MNAMFESTASSCGVAASAMSAGAPTVFCTVSSSVSPVNTRIVSRRSSAVSVDHEGMSLDSGTFSGNQKLPVRRFQTSRSLSSCRRFQFTARATTRDCTLSFMVLFPELEGFPRRASHPLRRFDLSYRRHLALATHRLDVVAEITISAK